MKKTILIVFVMFGSILYCSAQFKTGITTEEEYNYMTKGYQIQISSGLDMKKGYTLGEPIAIKDGNYSFNFISLLNGSKDSVLVGYIVLAHSNVSTKNYYFGIP